jgi:CheY-like chemotaxis protein
MGKKILLADDSITIQKVIELTFSDEDFEVVTVGNGRLAIEKVQEVRPDVVLCDIIMPEKDGYEVCDFIKRQPALAQIPVLLLTGAFEPFDQDRAARVGCDGFLAKPFEPQTLIAKVKDLLSQVAARPPMPAVPPPLPVSPSAFAPPPAPTLAASSVPAFVSAPAPAVAAPVSAPTPALSEPSMTYIPEEPEMEEAPLGFADVMDTVPAEPPEAFTEPALDPDAFAPAPAGQQPGHDELLHVSPEEHASLEPGPRSADPGATVMFQAVKEPPSPPPVMEQPRHEPAPAPASRSMFEEVFEEDLSATPEHGAPSAAVAPAPHAQPVPERLAFASEAAPEPVPEAPAEEVDSFADLGPPVAPAEEVPSAAAEVSVPVDQVAQIAQRVVGQISEKVIREIAWEVIPDLAEALIRQEIERLKSELQR